MQGQQLGCENPFVVQDELPFADNINNIVFHKGGRPAPCLPYYIGVWQESIQATPPRPAMDVCNKTPL